MRRRLSQNLGETRLRRRRRSADPMRTYDALPAPLRHWLADAALPWSPASAHRVWVRAPARGLSAEATLASLTDAEARLLTRDSLAHANTLSARN